MTLFHVWKKAKTILTKKRHASLSGTIDNFVIRWLPIFLQKLNVPISIGEDTLGYT
jgi:hypothetical protein